MLLVVKSDRSKYQLNLLLLLQTVLIVVCFYNYFAHPQEYMFYNGYDGAKNYYAYQSYLQQPAEDGLLRYTQMNHPFGDYIFYSDKTPLLAAAVRAFSLYVTDVTAYGIPIFNFFMLLNILFATAVSWRIGRLLLRNNGLTFVLALALPWINPMFLRLGMGHFNLSLSALLLLVIYLLLKLVISRSHRQRWGYTLVLAGTVIFSSYLHVYYLGIELLFINLFLLAWWVRNLLQKQAVLWPVISVVAVNGLSALLVVGGIRIMDGYYALRTADPGGYNWDYWNLSFHALYQSRDFHWIPFVFEPGKPVNYESFSYLGGFVLYSLFFLVVALRVRRKGVGMFQKPAGAAVLFMLIAATIGMFTAMGEQADIFGLKFTNVFNPLYYLTAISEKFKQFRALARFVWPFFFVMNIVVAVGIDRLMRENAFAGRRWLNAGILAAAAVLLMADAGSTIQFTKGHFFKNNLTHPEHTRAARELLHDVDTETYQAIMPIPYYHVGSTLEWTVDPADDWCIATFQYSLLAHLPLMANKTARAVPIHAQQQFNLLNGEDAAGLKQRLSDKPVLIILNQQALEEFQGKANDSEAQQTVAAGVQHIPEEQLTLIKKQGPITLYRWQIP